MTSIMSKVTLSQPILYVYEGSVWASAPQLAADELGYRDQLHKEYLNLAEGANFHPAFLNVNPNATLPTLATSDGVYTSTAAVVHYLVEHAPKPAGRPSGTDLVDALHAPAIDPNFSMLSGRSPAEIKAKAGGLPGAFARGRQAMLRRIAPTAPEHKPFYDKKLADNGFLVALYDETAPPPAVEAFIAQSHVHWKNVAKFISADLPAYLPESGFIGGDQPGEDDFHLAAWLARIVAVTGGSPAADGVIRLESELGGEGAVPAKVQNYWRTWSERESWKTLYAQGLH